MGRAVVRELKTFAAYLLLDSLGVTRLNFQSVVCVCVCVTGGGGGECGILWKTAPLPDTEAQQPHNNHGFVEILQALLLVYLLPLQEVQRKLDW